MMFQSENELRTSSFATRRVEFSRFFTRAYQRHKQLLNGNLWLFESNNIFGLSLVVYELRFGLIKINIRVVGKTLVGENAARTLFSARIRRV